MRIISGIFKGRRITLPAKIGIRPTTDFAKESLFNILNNKIDYENSEVLDLFAGTGSISYEFVSRGVANVTAIENNYKCVDFIKNNISILNIENLRIVRMSAIEFVKACTAQYDIIFADPPYDMPNIMLFAEQLLARKMLKPGGIFVLEHSAVHDFSALEAFIEKRHYGSVNFSFFSS